MLRFKKKHNTAQNPVPLIAASDRRSAVSEQYRAIRSNINFTMVDKLLKTLVVTSAEPNDGKSSVSSNLAIVYADAGKRVLLVDGDMRKPTLGLSFKIANPKGLSNLLTDRSISYSDVINETQIENLSVMTVGEIPPNPSELLGSEKMKTIIAELGEMYDLVIFDLPPLANISDAQVLASRVDGTVLVARSNKTNFQNLESAKNLLTMAKANIVGVVLNDNKKVSDSYYYYGN
jgi:capsular exopolysaccharide synthesis family protein